VLAALAIILISLWLHLVIQPYTDTTLSALEAWAEVTITLTLYLALYYSYDLEYPRR
jgi:hypothetical protein